jgi:hypothetical protein
VQLINQKPGPRRGSRSDQPSQNEKSGRERRGQSGSPLAHTGLMSGDSITARMSSIRVSRLGKSETRSDKPVPRLSKVMSRENEASRNIRCSNPGSPMDIEIGDEAGHEHQVEWPGAENLVGNMNVAALGVARSRFHGPSPTST